MLQGKLDAALVFSHQSNPGLRIEEWSAGEQAVELIAHSDAWALLPEVVIRLSSKRIAPLSVPRSWRATYRVCWVSRLHSASDGLIGFMELARERWGELAGLRGGAK